MAMKVWIVTAWTFGGGGDDSTEIVGVFADESDARVAADARDLETDDDVDVTLHDVR